MLFLPKNVSAVVLAAAKENARYSMTGVRVTDTGDGNYRLDATDGRVCLVVRGPSEVEFNSALDSALAPYLDAVSTQPAVVPYATWQDAFKLLNGSSGQLAMAVRDEYTNDDTDPNRQVITLISAKGTLTETAVEGRYPDVDGVFPKKAPMVRMPVNPKMLVRLLKALEPLLDETTERVDLCWYADKKVCPLLAVSGNNSQGQHFDGLVVGLEEAK